MRKLSARKQSIGTAGGRRKASVAISEAVSASALGRQRKASRVALQPGVAAALARAETTPAENLVVSIDDILGNAPSAAAASVKRDKLLGNASSGSGNDYLQQTEQGPWFTGSSTFSFNNIE